MNFILHSRYIHNYIAIGQVANGIFSAVHNKSIYIESPCETLMVDTRKKVCTTNISICSLVRLHYPMSDAWGIWEIHPDLVDGRYLDIACFLQCGLPWILISAFVGFVKINQPRKLLFSKCDVTYRRSNYEAPGIAILNSYDNSRKHPSLSWQLNN